MKQKKRRVLCILMAVCCLWLTACGGGEKALVSPSVPAAGEDQVDLAFPSEPPVMGGAETAPAPDWNAGGESTRGSAYQNADVKLIRRATLSIQTTEFEQSVAALERLVNALEGYYQEAQVRTGGYYDRNAGRFGDYTIRIPAQRYEEFMSQTENVGHLTSRYESTQDVGEPYYDLEARLKTQRTKQERLLALLEKAETMEDIIALESALSDVEYQIEQYSSELNRYDGLIGYATISLTLEEVIRVVEEPGEADSLGSRLLAGVSSSAIRLAEGFQDLLLWIAYHIFGIVIFAVILLAAVVILRKKRVFSRLRRRGQKKEEQQ